MDIKLKHLQSTPLDPYRKKPTLPSFSSGVPAVEPIPSDISDLDQLCKQFENDQNRTNGYLGHHLIRLKQQRNALTNRLDHVVCAALSLIAIKKPALYQNDQIRDVIYQLGLSILQFLL